MKLLAHTDQAPLDGDGNLAVEHASQFAPDAPQNHTLSIRTLYTLKEINQSKQGCRYRSGERMGLLPHAPRA